MNVKEIFQKAENGTLTYEQFESIVAENKVKFVDLSEGGYVSKNKYDNEIATHQAQIDTLSATITTRDTDLNELKSRLEAAGTDAGKLTELNTKLTQLQSQYDTDTRAYQDKLNRQAYEFAVREFAGSQKFTSNAAKRDFISSMLDKNLTMEGNSIMGADDFVKVYSENNADAFVVDAPTPTNPTPVLPTFVNPTPGPAPEDNGGFAFNFTGVRAKE